MAVPSCDLFVIGPVISMLLQPSKRLFSSKAVLGISIDVRLVQFLKAFVPILCVVLALALIGCAYGWYAARHKAPVTEADVAAASDAARMAEEAYRSTEFAVAHANEVELPALMRQIEENEQPHHLIGTECGVLVCHRGNSG